MARACRDRRTRRPAPTGRTGCRRGSRAPLAKGRAVELVERAVQLPPEAVVAPKEVTPVRRQRRAAAVVTAASALDQPEADRSLGIVEIAERVAIGPAGAFRGRPDRARRLDSAKQHHASVAERKPTARVQPYLVADGQPR